MLIAAASLAWGLDAHGPSLTPQNADILAPQTAWDPAILWRGSWGLSLTGEYAHAPLVAHLDLGATQRDEVWLEHVVATSITGFYSFGRIGVGADAPIVLVHTGEGEQGVAIGDLVVWAPIGILPAKDGGFGLLVVPELTLPTGDAETWLGGSLGGGLRIAAGTQAEHLRWNAEISGAWHPGDVLYDIDRSVLVRADLAAGWRFDRHVGLGVEGWFEAAPLTPGILSGSPGEVLGRASFLLGDGLAVNVAAGTGVTLGLGAADARAYLRVGYGAARVVATPVPTPVVPVGPYTLRVEVVDEAGHPIDAVVALDDAAPTAIGADGRLDVLLAQGTFDVDIHKAGYLQQRHHLVLGADRFRPAEIHAVLQREEAGDTALRVRVRDTEGRPVEGATLRLDGRDQGRSATDGDVRIGGLRAGEHVLAVDAPGFRPEDPVTIDTSKQAEATVVLDRPPGSVLVICRGPDGPVPDAQVAFVGPEDLPPAEIGGDGEETFVLLPGDWEAQVSAPAFGLQERTLHVESGSTSLVVVDVRLLDAEGGDASLVVRVVDPDGAPVDQAEVRLDGAPVGATANGGELRLDGLRAGTRRLSVSGAHYRDATPREVELLGGVREIEVVLGWRPGSLEVVARGVEGALTDAQVMLEGPETVAPTSLGPDGRAFFQLVPGSWHLMLSASSYGLQERDLVVRPDDTQLVEIDAGLLAQTGSATVDLRVVDPDGKPVPGARVSVDGRDAGTTATAGNVALSGLQTAPHRFEIAAPFFRPWSRTTSLAAGANTLVASLAWEPATVRVRARGPKGPARDALARFYGVEEMPPGALIPDGERLFQLLPGLWTLVVSSETLGFAESDVKVDKTGTTPQLVDVTLAPAGPAPRLLVMVVDPTGRPVSGATLTVADKVVPLAENGMTVLDGLAGSRVAVAASAPGFRDAPAEAIQLSPGMMTRRIRLRPTPRPVAIQVLDAAQKPIAATVRLSGPGRPVATSSLTDGKAAANVLPGTWQVLVEARGYGAWRADVPVAPGVTPLPIVATLSEVRAEVTATGVNLREQVQFDFAQATIRPDSYPLLEQIAAILLLHPEIGRVEVQGHTDARGTDVYNLDLSQRRAEAVVAYLVRRGLDPARLVANGYGATRPLATNDTEEGRTRNRRVQFELIPSGSVAPR